ncbi:hypothetical protein J437_LFUL013332 [Ladona fulva]|uniref:Regulatory protein zeste n=1 Tax=Ladona fulva TaxID=123851 RepID=A0A8K0KJT4_LADFU|nr:hypothetical protein J437_LFUL013332 [Ladona fulva]
MATRNTAFTLVEKRILIDLVEKFKKVLENKKTDASSGEQKREKWNQVTKEYNSHGNITRRDAKQLKRIQENIKVEQEEFLENNNKSPDFSEVTSSVHLERVEESSGNISLEKGTSEILKRISENKDTSEKIYGKCGIKGKKSISIIKSKRKEKEEEFEISDSEAPVQSKKKDYICNSPDFSEVISSVRLESIEDSSDNICLEKGTSEILKGISKIKDTSGIKGKKSISVIKSKRKEKEEESEISDFEAPAQRRGGNIFEVVRAQRLKYN